MNISDMMTRLAYTDGLQGATWGEDDLRTAAMCCAIGDEPQRQDDMDDDEEQPAAAA